MPIADARRHRVNQTAFNTRRCQQTFTRPPVDATIRTRQAERDGFQRLARETAAEVLAPVDIETAIRWLERRYANVARFQVRDPCGVGAKPGPACATQCEYDCIGLNPALTFRRGESQSL